HFHGVYSSSCLLLYYGRFCTSLHSLRGATWGGLSSPKSRESSRLCPPAGASMATEGSCDEFGCSPGLARRTRQPILPHVLESRRRPQQPLPLVQDPTTGLAVRRSRRDRNQPSLRNRAQVPLQSSVPLRMCGVGYSPG